MKTQSDRVSRKANWHSLYGAMLAILAATQAVAAEDKRIKVVTYDPATVYDLGGCPGYQTSITFGPAETIENVALGDSNSWQATPNKRADTLFVKPNVANGRSNLTIVTTRFRYNFNLRTKSASECEAGQVIFDLRFAYPPSLALPSANAKDRTTSLKPSVIPPEIARNANYTFAGDIHLVPLRVFDDNKFTYFQWPEGLAPPAVYAIGVDRTESIVNFAMREGYIVVEQIAPGYVLRSGERKATLYNESFTLPARDSLSPKPRKGEKVRNTGDEWWRADDKAKKRPNQ